MAIRDQILDPSIDDLFEKLYNVIFSNINCVQIGKIDSFNKDEQTVKVQIQFKRALSKTEIKSYPLLLDVPVFVLQGGGNFLEFPIEQGDYCIVLFNDRCIDDWFEAGIEKEPLCSRKHSLSDGIALIGINPKSSPLGLMGNIVRLSTVVKTRLESTEDVEINSDKQLVLQEGSDFAVRHNELKDQVDKLNTRFETILNVLNTWTPVAQDGGSALSVAVQATVIALDTAGIISADFSNIKVSNINLPGVGE